MTNPHEHFWRNDLIDRRWEQCAYTDCDARRHRPLRDDDATTCPKTATGEHQWQPLSFVFETQMLDDSGRVVVRQPDIDRARVYAVCMPCRSHTYIETAWVGYFLGYPFMEEEQERNDKGDTQPDGTQP
ncbi:hypothetical protein ACFCW4_02725 [Streptomyces virginiae]|uniref:hypothetical protein n=1 Tax=Streptomyces virginiae TaxID=1961 RepID=UPI0035DBF594